MFCKDITLEAGTRPEKEQSRPTPLQGATPLPMPSPQLDRGQLLREDPDQVRFVAPS